jgi:hypothetical protein
MPRLGSSVRKAATPAIAAVEAAGLSYKLHTYDVRPEPG